MNFKVKINTKEISTSNEFKPSQYIFIGPRELKISKIDVKLTKNKDKFGIFLFLESKPIDYEGWTGIDGAKGQIGQVQLGIWTNGTDQQMIDILTQLSIIADELGVRQQFDDIKCEDIYEYINSVSSLFVNKFKWWLIGGEEYLGQDKNGNPKVKVSIKLPRFSFIADSEDGLKNKMKNKEFPLKGRPDTQWYFKELTKMDSDELNNVAISSIQKTEDDLPF